MVVYFAKQMRVGSMRSRLLRVALNICANSVLPESPLLAKELKGITQFFHQLQSVGFMLISLIHWVLSFCILINMHLFRFFYIQPFQFDCHQMLRVSSFPHWPWLIVQEMDTNWMWFSLIHKLPLPVIPSTITGHD